MRSPRSAARGRRPPATASSSTSGPRAISRDRSGPGRPPTSSSLRTAADGRARARRARPRLGTAGPLVQHARRDRPRRLPRDGRGPRDLAAFKTIAVADPQAVPAGVYARRWLEGLGLWTELAPRVVPTLDVRAALAAVESENAEAGIVYRTDAAPRSARASPSRWRAGRARHRAIRSPRWCARAPAARARSSPTCARPTRARSSPATASSCSEANSAADPGRARDRRLQPRDGGGRDAARSCRPACSRRSRSPATGARQGRGRDGALAAAGAAADGGRARAARAARGGARRSGAGSRRHRGGLHLEGGGARERGDGLPAAGALGAHGLRGGGSAAGRRGAHARLRPAGRLLPRDAAAGLARHARRRGARVLARARRVRRDGAWWRATSRAGRRRSRSRSSTTPSWGGTTARSAGRRHDGARLRGAVDRRVVHAAALAADRAHDRARPRAAARALPAARRGAARPGVTAVMGPSGVGEDVAARGDRGAAPRHAGRIAVDGAAAARHRRRRSPAARGAAHGLRAAGRLPLPAPDGATPTCASARSGRRRASWTRGRDAGARAAARPLPAHALRRRAAARGARARARDAAARCCCWTSRSPRSTSALRERMLPYLLRVRDESQVPVLYVTHNLGEALVLARARAAAARRPRRGGRRALRAAGDAGDGERGRARRREPLQRPRARGTTSRAA